MSLIVENATTDARSKLQATTPLLDKARGDYDGLTKATSDARSKLEAITPLLDKARGEYEELTKRIDSFNHRQISDGLTAHAAA
jgi:hypothetical protein